MSIVLIHQYTETEKQDNETLQAEFTKNGVNTVIVPGDLSVQWLPGVGEGQIAIISIASFTSSSNTKESQNVRLAQHINAAEKLKEDLADNDIQAIILPSDTSVEVMPF